MAATETDFENTETTSDNYWVTQWPKLARATGALKSIFNAKQTTGTEPDDLLTGWFYSDETLTKAVRIYIDTSKNVIVSKNTGTDGSPVWVQMFHINGSTSAVTLAGALAMAGNAISGIAGLTLSSGNIDVGSGGIVNAGAVSGVAGLTLTSGNLAMGGGNITNLASVTSQFNVNASDGGSSRPVSTTDLIAYSPLGRASSYLTLADDTATSKKGLDDDVLGVDFNAAQTMQQCFIHIDGRTNGYAWVFGDYSTPDLFSAVLGSDIEITTGVLTGTTGSDTKFTVSLHTDGKWYFENRIGSNVDFRTFVTL